MYLARHLLNLYNIILSYQITSTVNDNIDCESHWIFNGNCADDMQIHIVDYNGSGTLSIFYDYKTSKYVKSEIKQMHERINHIIEQVLQDDSINIENIEIDLVFVIDVQKKEFLNSIERDGVVFDE